MRVFAKTRYSQRRSQPKRLEKLLGGPYYVIKLRQNVGLETRLWRQIATSQIAHTKYKWPPYATQGNPPMKIVCVRQCLTVTFSVG